MRIGPLGGLREVVTFPEVPVEIERAGSSWTTLGGRRVAQRAPRPLRSWSMDYRLIDPADLAYLSALASGAVPGPHYLYTEAAAQSNLLPADIAAPGAMGLSGLLLPGGGQPARGRVPAMVSGALASVVGVSLDPALAGEWSQMIALPLGAYRLSCWSTAARSTVARWRTVDAVGGQVSTGVLTTSAVSGGFRGLAAVTVSGAAVGLQVQLGLHSDPFFRVGAFRLTAGTAQSVEWVPGRGVPQVVVDDPGEVLQLARAGEVRADYTVTLREVG